MAIDCSLWCRGVGECPGLVVRGMSSSMSWCISGAMAGVIMGIMFGDCVGGGHG